jgi:hypothetical protein
MSCPDAIDILERDPETGVLHDLLVKLYPVEADRRRFIAETRAENGPTLEELILTGRFQWAIKIVRGSESQPFFIRV